MNDYIPQHGQLCKRRVPQIPRKNKYSDYDVFMFLNKRNHTSINLCDVLDLRTLQIRGISTTLLEFI